MLKVAIVLEFKDHYHHIKIFNRICHGLKYNFYGMNFLVCIQSLILLYPEIQCSQTYLTVESSKGNELKNVILSPIHSLILEMQFINGN